MSKTKVQKKMKSHKGLQARVKITGTGKIMHKKVGRNHLLTNKGRSNKVFTLGKELSGAHVEKVKHLLPYGA